MVDSAFIKQYAKANGISTNEAAISLSSMDGMQYNKAISTPLSQTSLIGLPDANIGTVGNPQGIAPTTPVVDPNSAFNLSGNTQTANPSFNFSDGSTQSFGGGNETQSAFSRSVDPTLNDGRWNIFDQNQSNLIDISGLEGTKRVNAIKENDSIRANNAKGQFDWGGTLGTAFAVGDSINSYFNDAQSRKESGSRVNLYKAKTDTINNTMANKNKFLATAKSAFA